MSKHQIFLVHGMGNFEAGWSEVVRKRLLDALAEYPTLHDAGFADGLEFKEILYNDSFEAWRTQWREDANAATNALTAVGASSEAVKGLVAAAGAPGGGGFIATHVLDVVAFRFLMPIAQTVCRAVQTQILGHLKAFPANDIPRYSIIAHSLGTSVIYETYQQMLTQVIDGSLLTPAFRPDNVFMVANTGKLLWNRGGGTAYPACCHQTSSTTAVCAFASPTSAMRWTRCPPSTASIPLTTGSPRARRDQWSTAMTSFRAVTCRTSTFTRSSTT
jgi:hypothetical protein